MMKRGNVCLADCENVYVPQKRSCVNMKRSCEKSSAKAQTKAKGATARPNAGRRVLGDIGNTLTQEEVVGSAKEIVKAVKPPTLLQQAPLSSVDEPRRYDAVYAAVYVDQIVERMRQQEASFMVAKDFLEFQKDVTPRMRAILVDWMVEVHHRFKLSQETLFLAVNYLDRFLAVKQMNRNRLQLAGVTCLWIASKFQDIYQPELKDFEFVTDKACTSKEMLEMEVSVLETLDFNLVVPTAACFLQRHMQIAGVEPNSFVAHMASFFLECTLGDVQFAAVKPSLLSLSSVYLAKKACKMAPHWSPEMEELTGYNQQLDVRAPAKALCAIVNNLQKSAFQAVRIKFASDRYKKVAREVVAGPVPAASSAGRVQPPKGS
eukprot:Platyproteum_vivax@DN2542_c0_g1_i1.p1